MQTCCNVSSLDTVLFPRLSQAVLLLSLHVALLSQRPSESSWQIQRFRLPPAYSVHASQILKKTLETRWIVKKVQEKLAATSPEFLAHNQERSAQRGCRGPLSIWGGNVSFTESSIGIRAIPAVVSREGLFPMNLLSHPRAKAYPDRPQATTGINVKN